MKRTRKLVSWLLTLVMLFSLVNGSCLTAWAEASATDVGGVTAPTDTGSPTDTASQTNALLLSEPPEDNHLPTLKEGVEKVKEDQVLTGMAYLLSDLQAGKIFEDADEDDNKKLSYTNIYWERSTDKGESWSAKLPFVEALFGMTTIQVTENTEGIYWYRFYMSDGKGISTD